MSLSKPKVPAPANPAPRPERVIDVQPEDVTLGDPASQDQNARKGKRALLRPSSVSPVSIGTAGGTGLSV